MDQVYLSWGDWYTVAPGEDNKNQSQETIVHQEWAEDEGNYKEVEKRKEASQLVARMPRQWQAKTQGVSNVARCHRKPGISTECPLHQTNRRPLRKLTCAEAVGLLLLLPSRFSRVRLCATPQTEAHQAPLSLGLSRQEHWSGSRRVQMEGDNY